MFSVISQNNTKEAIANYLHGRRQNVFIMSIHVNKKQSDIICSIFFPLHFVLRRQKGIERDWVCIDSLWYTAYWLSLISVYDIASYLIPILWFKFILHNKHFERIDRSALGALGLFGKLWKTKMLKFEMKVLWGLMNRW